MATALEREVPVETDGMSTALKPAAQPTSRSTIEGQELVPIVSNAVALLAMPAPPAPLPTAASPAPPDIGPVRSDSVLAHSITSDRSTSQHSDHHEQVTDASDVVVLHVLAGSQYQALLYLLRSVSRHFRMDDILPDVPERVASANYILLNSPVGLVNGDAATLFEHPSHPPGLLVSRTNITHGPKARHVTPAQPRYDPDSIDREGQTHLLFNDIVDDRTQVLMMASTSQRSSSRATSAEQPGASLTQPLESATLEAPVSRPASREPPPELFSPFGFVVRVTWRQARAWVRLAGASRLSVIPDRPRLVPVALPAHSGYLQMAAEAIMAFNKRGLQLTPYLDQTCLASAAACRIQAAYRAHQFRSHFQVHDKKIQARAARVIQRAWKAYLMRMRMRMLRQMAIQSHVLENLILGDSLALTVEAVDMLTARTATPVVLFPEHRVQFGFTFEDKVFQVAPLSVPRPGLPHWTGATQTVLRKEEAVQQYGNRALYGQKQILLLLTQGATWKSAGGEDLRREAGLPRPPADARSSDVLLQLVFSSPREARARACLLLALTWEPVACAGVELQPPHTTSLARSMPCRRTTDEASSHLAMHTWTSLNSHLSSTAQQRAGSFESPPGSAIHSVVSYMSIPDHACLQPALSSPAVSRAVSPAHARPLAGGGSNSMGNNLPQDPSRSPSRGMSRGISQDMSRGTSPGGSLTGPLFTPFGPLNASRGASRGATSNPPATLPIGHTTTGGIMGVIKLPPRATCSPTPDDDALRGLSGPEARALSRSQRSRRCRSPPGGQPGAVLRPAEGATAAQDADTPPLPAADSDSAQALVLHAPPAGISSEFEFRPVTAQAMLQPHAQQEQPLMPGLQAGEAVATPRPSSAASALQHMSDQLSDTANTPPLSVQPVNANRTGSGSGSGRASPATSPERGMGAGSESGRLPVRPPSASEASAIQEQVAPRRDSGETTGGAGSRPSSARQHTSSSRAGSARQRAQATGPPDSSHQQQQGQPSQPNTQRMPAKSGAAAALQSTDGFSSDLQSIGPWQTDSCSLLPPTHPNYPSLPTSPTLDALHGLDQNGRPIRLLAGNQGAPHPATLQHLPWPYPLGPWQAQPQTATAPQPVHPPAGSVHGTLSVDVTPASHREWSSDGPQSPNTLAYFLDTQIHSPVRGSGRVQLQPLLDMPADIPTQQQQQEQPHQEQQQQQQQQQGYQSAGPATAAGAGAGAEQRAGQGTRTGTGPVPAAGPGTMLHSGVQEERGLAAERHPHAHDLGRMSRAVGLQQSMLYLGGPESIARTMPGHPLAGGALAPARLVSTVPYAAHVGSMGGVEGMAEARKTVHDHFAAKASIMQVIPAQVQEVYMPDLMDEMQFKQAMLQRHGAYETEEVLIAARDKHIAGQQRRCRSVRQPSLVWIKHTGTGHALAPDYTPLTPLAMAKLVAEMRAVYRAAAAQQVTAQRAEHDEVMREVVAERIETRQAVVSVTARQTEVLATLKAAYRNEWTQAAQGRVTHRAMGDARTKRVQRERAFAQAFARQAGLLGRHVQRGERAVLQSTEYAETWHMTHMHRTQRQEREENIAKAQSDLTALNQWKAAAVRTGGFTQEIRDYQEAADAYNRDVVTLRRLEDISRSQRVGPPGGVWGAARPREALREPLPLGTVVSAADAKRHRRQMRQQAAREAQQEALEQQRRQQRRDRVAGPHGVRHASVAGGQLQQPSPRPGRQTVHATSQRQRQEQQSQQERNTTRETPRPWSQELDAAQSFEPHSMLPPISVPHSATQSADVATEVQPLGLSHGLPPLPRAQPRPDFTFSRAFSAATGAGGSRATSATSRQRPGSRGYSGTGSYFSGSDLSYDTGYESDGLDSVAGGDAAKAARVVSASSRIVQAVSEGSDGSDVDVGDALRPSYMQSPVNAGFLSEGDEDEDEDEPLMDFLPEMPYAKGARLLAAARSARPTGIVA